MPKIAYQDIKMSRDRLDLVETCNDIIDEYQAEDFILTLRQLYYQLVSRDIIPNRTQEYKRLGDVVNSARLAGLMDWTAIEDRTRNLEYGAHWGSPQEILEACASQFRVDRWSEQDVHPEVWIEKEALAGVFSRICNSLDVGMFACRGYTSQSEMWVAGQRFINKIRDGKQVVVFHFGDHDPSGIDMSRDILDRLRMFVTHHVGAARGEEMLDIRRLALNMDQVRRYNPPENPAKTTDSRFESYLRQFGDKSWELDALNPRTLTALVRDNVLSVCDKSLWEDLITTEATARGQLKTVATTWGSVENFVERQFPDALESSIEDAKEAIEREMDGDASEDEE